MHADHAVDDELEACEPDATMRDAGEVEGTVRIADVHHDLGRDRRQRIQLQVLLLERQCAVVDKTRVALGARHGDRCALANRLGGIAAADDRGDAELARDDGSVTGATAAIRDDRRGAFHHGFPIRIGHVSDEHVAALHPRHLLHVADDARRSCADSLAD
jgi:hypothetical protein